MTGGAGWAIINYDQTQGRSHRGGRDGLDGFCDFLVAQSPHQLELEAPVLCAVKAKEHSMKLGIPQCIATMYAASLYNIGEKAPRERVHGLVTTGSN